MSRIFFLLCSLILDLSAIINPMNVYTAQKFITQTITVPTQSTITQTTTTPQTITVQVNQQTGIIPFSPSSIGSSGALIRDSGIHQITSTIIYTGNTTAITISESNITLDLNNQTICFNGNQNNGPVHGITIANGLKNITIKNGTICGFPGCGIYASGNQNNVSTHIIIDSVNVIDCFNGILICYGTNIYLKNCLTCSNKNPTSQTMGFFLSNCSFIKCNNCLSNNNVNELTECYGFFIQNSSLITLQNCTAHTNQGIQKTVGIYLKNIQKHTFFNHCSTQANMSCFGESHGFLLEDSTNISLNNISSLHNQTNDRNFFSYGIRLTNTHFTTIKESTFDGNDYGIYDDESLNTETNTFIKNSALGNKKADYLRPFSSPFSFKVVNRNFLQSALQAGPLENISIKNAITST